MKISDYSANKLGEFLAGDIPGWPYRRGVDLVDFFNKHGFRDFYGEGFPTRRVFAQAKVKELNGKSKLKDVIREMLDPRLWIDLHTGNIEEAVKKTNELLQYDGYEVIQDGNFYKVRELSGSVIEVETRFDKSSELSELLIEVQIRKCKEKIELASDIHENDGDLNKLFNRTRKLLNLDPIRKDISDSLKQVLSGLSKYSFWFSKYA